MIKIFHSFSFPSFLFIISQWILEHIVLVAKSMIKKKKSVKIVQPPFVRDVIKEIGFIIDANNAKMSNG